MHKSVDPDRTPRSMVIRTLSINGFKFYSKFFSSNMSQSKTKPTIRLKLCDQRRFRSACAAAQSDQSLCWSQCYSLRAIQRGITKTRLYNFDPLQPHFYIVKLGFTGVYIIFLISAQKHRLWVLVYLKIFLFWVVKFSIYLNRCVFVMMD